MQWELWWWDGECIPGGRELMAEAAVAARRKVLGAALCMSSVMMKGEEGTSESIGGRRGGKPKAIALKARLAALEEKIIREAAAREASCRNEDEERALRIALEALSSNDVRGVAKARAALEIRLEHVARRTAVGPRAVAGCGSW